MAIATDSYQNIQYSGSTVSQIGLSKTLDNYTWDEIFDYQYCSMCNGLSRIVAPYAANTNIEDYDVTKLGFTVEITDSWDGDADFKAEQTGIYIYPQGLYSKIIWLRGTRTETNTYQLYDSNMSNFKLVTEWDAPNFIFTLPSPISTFGACATSWSDDESTVKTTWDTDIGQGSLAYRYRHDGTYDDISISGNVMPYLLYKHNGHYYCQQLRQTSKFFGATIDKSGSSAKVGANNLIYPVEDTTVNSLSFFGGNVAADGFYYETDRSGTAYNPWKGNYKQVTKKYAYCDLDNDDCMGRFAYAGTGPSQYCGLETYFKTKHASLLFWAGCGVKFYADKLYKPVIEDGFVTDFSDDMTTPSDLDNWSGDSNHSVPVTPPSPPTPVSGDDIDDHEMGAGSGISGMANLWLLTKAQLDDLHGAFNSAPGGFDPLNSLISVMGLGVAPTYLFSDIEVITPINIRKSDGTSWPTGVEGHIVDSQKSAFQFTGITVNRKYNNFLDYSPYAIHEIFIPMCGWLTLPDIAVDRSITVTYLPDVESLKCRAVVSVVDNSGNRCVIGEKDGIMGADVPFTNTGHSLYVGEAIINGMNVAGEVITGAIGAGFTKTNAKGGTYRPYEGFTVGMGGTLPGAIGNAIVSGQTNRTHYMTGNGTRIGFSDGENIQIKSTYHNIDKPANYDHTVGKVCNKTGTLSEFHGFTVCDNPHIHISALEEEKSEIKSLLEQGVILPSGE